MQNGQKQEKCCDLPDLQICQVVWQILTKLTKYPEVILAKTKSSAKPFSLEK
jgi:hypothetical protein